MTSDLNIFNEENMPTSVRIVLSTRSDGTVVRTNQNHAAAVSNRDRILNPAGLSQEDTLFICASHSANVGFYSAREPISSAAEYQVRVAISKPLVHTDFDNYQLGIDGYVMRGQGPSIGLLAADCVPLFAWSDDGSTYGLVHVGMLGAANNIVASFIEALLWAGVPAREANFLLGPTLDQEDYRLSGSGLWLSLKGQLWGLEFIRQHTKLINDDYRFDLRAAVAARLRAAGCELTRISYVPGSTAATGSQFHSHFASKDRSLASLERNLSVIGAV